MRQFFTHLLLTATLLTLCTATATAKKCKKVDHDIYGFVRTDFFYNSRESLTSFNDIFYLLPLDEKFDSLGEDMNAQSSAGMFSFISRLGLDVKGPNVGKATATAKIEVDFGGYGDFNMLLRLRHAYVNLNWAEKGHSLIVGQTWHPMFGSVMPYISNVSTGAPFQPFARSPQVRYEYRNSGWLLTAAALCQIQYNSNGPLGASNDYQIDSSIPEIYAGFDHFSDGGFQFGAGAYMLHLAPRNTATVVNGSSTETFKVDELMRAISGEVHLRYTNDKLNIGAKSVYGSALDGMAMLGGYGAVSESGANHQREYTPLHTSSSWVNITYGKVWKPTLYVGYTKNLGSCEPLMDSSAIYGRGTDIDQLVGVNLGVTYNRPSWSVGVECSSATAWYGTIDLPTGRVYDTHDVTNMRVAANMTYMF